MTQQQVDIQNVNILDNVVSEGKSGIAVNFNCSVYGYRGDLPSEYYGELCIDIVVIDGYDNIVATKKNKRFFYSTL